MPASWRIAAGAIAIALVAIGAPLWVLSYNGEQRSAREAETQYIQDHTTECVLVPSGRRVCGARAPKAEQPETYAEQDLHAQQDMAVWALGVFLASLGTLALTGVGVWLLRRTLEATNATLHEAEKATAAANNANVQFAEQSKRELRAYVCVEDPVPEALGRGVHSVEIRIKNMGQTPAICASALRNFNYISGGIQSGFDFADMEAGQSLLTEPTQFVLGPGQRISLTVQEWEQEDIQRLERGFMGRAFVWGWIEYDDIFSPATPRRRTEFCYEIVGIQLPNGTWTIRCRHRTKYNAMDEDCLRPVQTVGRKRDIQERSDVS